MKFGSINAQASYELAHLQKPQPSGPGKRVAPQGQVDVKSVDQYFRQASKKMGVVNKCTTPTMQAPREVRQAPDFASIITAVKLDGSHRL